MDSSLYVAFSGLQADMRAVELVANNLANVNTNGFREERSFVTALEAAGELYPRIGRTYTNTDPGPLVSTGRDLDLAIEGEGFLVIQTPEGRRYTRDGGLSLSEDGELVTKDGATVLGQGGPIRIPPGKVDIDADGRVMVAGVPAGRLLLVRFPEGALAREPGGRYRSTGEAETPAIGDRLRQGYLEKSNVGLSTGELDQLQRHFQALSRAIQVVSGLERQLITTARGE